MQLRLQEKTASPPDSALEEADWQAAQVNLDCRPIDWPPNHKVIKFSL